jgi:Fe-S-cluster containining protein
MDEHKLWAAMQQLANDNQQALQSIAELQQQLETLIEILLAKGELAPAHLVLIQRLRQRVEAARKGEIELASDEDKYSIEGEPIDCENRLHLCLGRCCSFGVLLSRQDLAEGQLTWEIEKPYRLSRGADGYCSHLGRDDARCERYEHRPATCRSYTCKTDPRVWLDFEARIPAPMPMTVIPLGRLVRR